MALADIASTALLVTLLNDDRFIGKIAKLGMLSACEPMIRRAPDPKQSVAG